MSTTNIINFDFKNLNIHKAFGDSEGEKDNLDKKNSL